MTSEQLRGLAANVRSGTSIDWSKEADAIVIEQVAQDAEYAERIKQQWDERILIDGSQGVSDIPEGNG